MKDGKIAVVESEAEQVRLIYQRYFELSGVNALVRDLKERNIRTDDEGVRGRRVTRQRSPQPVAVHASNGLSTASAA
jgi:hypothetical protein